MKICTNYDHSLFGAIVTTGKAGKVMHYLSKILYNDELSHLDDMLEDFNECGALELFIGK